MQPNIDLSNQQVSSTCHALNELLSNTYTLYLKLQFFHWNVEGPFFHTWHKISEEQYQELALAIDEIAERIRALGNYAPGSFKQFLHHTFLDEFSVPTTAEEMSKELLDNHEKIIQHLRTHWVPSVDQNSDVGTLDLFTRRLAAHEKFSWQLRSIMG